MVRQAMPTLSGKWNVILPCDSWYAKKNLTCVVDEYPNLDLICNARYDSVIYDLVLQRTGKRGHPTKHGKRLSLKEDFCLSNEKMGDYYTGVRRVLTNIFTGKEVLAYVTSTEKEGASRRLFFSTIVPEQMQMTCAWQEKALFNQTGNGWIKYIPLFCYGLRWNIEISYYEQKTFWLLCSYMVRIRKGIEILVNRIHITYSAMKILPYLDEAFSKYRTESVQEFRFFLSEQIRQQVFFATFVQNTVTSIKSKGMIKALKQLVQQQCWHL